MSVDLGYGWRGVLLRPRAEEEEKFLANSWKFAFPVDQTLQALDELAAAGWLLQSVSEDREVSGSVSFIRRSRHLLVRSV
jgi:fermentation-respiration switch protein FrsA (DUF1100 family)